jgi:hypothetical protein
MEAKEKYSERRRNERRHDARRSNVRRGDVRLDSSFEASLLDHNGKTVNVSASGVYFEVITNDMEAFPLGTTIPLQINAVTHTYEGREGTLKITGRGKVIRNCIIENPDHANSLGVALEFTEKLHTDTDYD